MRYKNDELIFNYIRDNPGLDGVELSKLLGISYPSVKNSLVRLMETELVVRVKRRLYTYKGVDEYKEPVPDKKEVVAGTIETPSALLKKENLDVWGNIVAIGQTAYKITEQGRDLHHTKLPYSKETYQDLLDKLNAMSVQITEQDWLWFYNMLLVTQLVKKNFAFFNTLPTAPYPVEDVTESIIKAIKDEY